MPLPIRLLPLCREVTRSQLLALAPDAPIVACDCYVHGAELGHSVVGGYQLGPILNIDHHAPAERMATSISSANLALERVDCYGVAPDHAEVFITHTDCDSVLSSGIIRGTLEPRPEFGAAALAADHTGESNLIADLLQALDSARDLAASMRSLEQLLAGQPLDSATKHAVENRQRRRELAAAVIAANRFQITGLLRWGVLDEPIDGEFLPALLPDAAVIMTAVRIPELPLHWVIKIRLGLAASRGLTLHGLDLVSLDPAYGGRWNAGSNKRGGGTTQEPERYAAGISTRLNNWLATLSTTL